MTARYFPNLCRMRWINICKNHVSIKLSYNVIEWLLWYCLFVSVDARETWRLAALQIKQNSEKEELNSGEIEILILASRAVYWEWIKPKIIASRRCLKCKVNYTWPKIWVSFILFGIRFRGFCKMNSSILGK